MKSNSTTYTCPMHPEVRQDSPGTCPTCGMQLIPANEKHGDEALAQSDKIQIPTTAI